MVMAMDGMLIIHFQNMVVVIFHLLFFCRILMITRVVDLKFKGYRKRLCFVFPPVMS